MRMIMSLSIIPPFSETLKYFETLFIAAVKYFMSKALSESVMFPKALLTYNCTKRSYTKSLSLCSSLRNGSPAKPD